MAIRGVCVATRVGLVGVEWNGKGWRDVACDEMR